MSNSNYLTIDNVSQKDIQRFFDKVEINPATGCWIWTAGTIGFGYGLFYYKGKKLYAHRFSYAWLIEPIPNGLSKTTPQLDHIACDTKHCVNPWHLKLVLPRENLLRDHPHGYGRGLHNIRKTRCPNGHDYKFYKNGPTKGRRYCPVCNLESYHRNKYKIQYPVTESRPAAYLLGS